MRRCALGTAAHVRCVGKGRKEPTPLRKDRVDNLRAWLAERDGAGSELLFVSNRGARLSGDAVERIARKDVGLAATTGPTHKGKRTNLKYCVTTPRCSYSRMAWTTR